MTELGSVSKHRFDPFFPSAVIASVAIGDASFRVASHTIVVN